MTASPPAGPEARAHALARARRGPVAAVATALLGTAALLGAGCGGDGGDTDASAGPDGAALYRQTCASCHGEDLRGTNRGPSHLSEVYEPGHHPDESFRAAIARGAPAHHWDFGDMPPVEGLDDDEIEAVIAYVREQQEAEGFEPYPPP